MRLITLFFTLFAAFFVINLGSGMLTFPLEKDYAEGIYLVCSRDVFANSYSSLCAQPPVFYILQNFTGGTFFSGRLISLLSLFGSVIVCFLIIKYFTNSEKIALISLILLILPYSFFWSTIGIADCLMVFLSLLSIYLMLHKDKSFIILIASAFIVFLSTFTKYTGFFVFLAIFIYLLSQKRKHLVIFTSSYLLFVLFSFLIINISTNGSFYSSAFMFHLSKGWDTSTAKVINYIIFILPEIPFIILSFLAIRKNLISLYFIANLTLGSVLFFKAGSANHYFLPLEASMIPIVGFSIKKFEKTKLKKLAFSLLSLQILIATVMCSAYFYDFAKYSVENDNQKILDLVNNSEGNVISEYVSFNILSGKTVIKESFDPFAHSVFLENGLWNDSVLVGECKNVSVFMTSFRFDDFKDFMHYIENNYKESNFRFYIPAEGIKTLRVFRK